MMKRIAVSMICVMCIVACNAGIVRSSAGSSHIEFAKMQREPPEPLPDGCVAVKWLESDGSAYINTGIKMERTYGFSIDFTTFYAGQSQQMHICGGYAQSRLNYMCRIMWQSSGTKCWIYGYAAHSTSFLYGINCGGSLEQRHIVLNDPTKACYVDGNVAYEGEAYGFPEGSSENLKPYFGIFATLNLNGENYNKNTVLASPLRVYRCILFNGEDELLFDGIPIRYEEDGRGYLYDRVSGLLFGSATDVEFTIGPDVY